MAYPSGYTELSTPVNGATGISQSTFIDIKTDGATASLSETPSWASTADLNASLGITPRDLIKVYEAYGTASSAEKPYTLYLDNVVNVGSITGATAFSVFSDSISPNQHYQLQPVSDFSSRADVTILMEGVFIDAVTGAASGTNTSTTAGFSLLADNYEKEFGVYTPNYQKEFSVSAWANYSKEFSVWTANYQKEFSVSAWANYQKEFSVWTANYTKEFSVVASTNTDFSVSAQKSANDVQAVISLDKTRAGGESLTISMVKIGNGVEPTFEDYTASTDTSWTANITEDGIYIVTITSSLYGIIVNDYVLIDFITSCAYDEEVKDWQDAERDNQYYCDDDMERYKAYVVMARANYQQARLQSEFEEALFYYNVANDILTIANKECL